MISSSVGSVLGLVAAVVIIADLAWRGREGSDIAASVALALAAYTMVAGFTLPWYALWAIPVAAMSWRRSISVVTAWHGAIVFAAYQAGTVSVSGRISGGMLTFFLPLATVAILVVLVLDRPAGTGFGLRRVDVDAASGQLGSELVQGG